MEVGFIKVLHGICGRTILQKYINARMFMRVLLLRSSGVDPDPRVEKEVNSLLKMKDITVEILAWDRSDNYKIRRNVLFLSNGSVVVNRIGVKAGWGVGISNNAKAFFKFSIRAFRWLISHHKEYDCIHACDLHTVVPSWIPIFLYRKKFVYDIFDYFADTAQGGNALILKLARRVENYVINCADAVIVCSEKRISQIIPSHPKKLAVIHNAPSRKQLVAQTELALQTNNNRVKIVYVGNLVNERYILQLIEAVKRIEETELHIGGIGSLEDEIINLSTDRNNKLSFYGKLKYEDVITLEKQCDIMVALYDPDIPNHKYASPNKFYEALALGKPLIMFRNTGMDYVIEQNSIGAVIGYTVDDICAGINEVINKKKGWNVISNKEKELFEKEYSWEIMENRLVELYQYVSTIKYDSKWRIG